MTHRVPIKVQSSLAVCKSLSSLLMSSFGPNALQVMYTSTTGKVLLTSDGSTILGVMHVSHPIGRWLIDRVIKFHTCTGDHAKSFLFLVRSILEEIAHELDSSVETVDRKSVLVNHQEEVIKLGKALWDVLKNVFPERVLPVLIRHSFSVSEVDSESMDAIIASVLHTHLSSHMSPKQAKFMSTLLLQFMKEYAGPDTEGTYFPHLQKALLRFLDNFEVTCLETVGLPYESSYIIDGIIISRDAITSHQEKMDPHKNFAILGFNPQKDVHEHQATITARTVEDLLLNMQYTRVQMMRMVRQLVDCNVTVLLSPEYLPALLLSLLQKAGITVIHTIPTAEIQQISHAANVNIIHEITSHLDSSFIGFAKEVKQVIFGNQRVTQIILDDHIRAKHLIICSPSEGMCRVLSQAVCNAVRCVKCLLETNPAEFLGLTNAVTLNQQGLDSGEQRCLLISAGGAAELIASNILEHEHFAHKDSHYKSVVLKIIFKALLCIPRTIHQNSFAGTSECSSSFLEILNQVKSRSDSEHAMGIDGKSGDLCFPHVRGAVESMASKYLLWSAVIETVHELLKMDIIIPVSRTAGSRDDEDDDQ